MADILVSIVILAIAFWLARVIGWFVWFVLVIGIIFWALS